MKQEAINLQQEAVKQLVDLTKTVDSSKAITFKAPTGSGKTYMMADMMNRILEKDSDIVFLVSSFSKLPLPFALVSHRPIKPDITAFLGSGRSVSYRKISPFFATSNTN
ncbi:MAG: DEAD/DEAH box helicase family protein [Oscillospiraceae bacterium]|nr:DEAD/DEAH box helicase family protein [Oscillospiraceae bacterium]